LSSALSTISGDTLDITTILGEDEVLGLSGGELTGFTYSTDISTITSDITSLSSALSSEISATNSDVLSLSTAIGNVDGVGADNAGSGLTYTATVSGGTLDVVVDGYTIKIVDDGLRGTESWMQFDGTSTISGTTTGATNISLDYDPVGYVSAFVNGIEYLVSPLGGESVTGAPFFFDDLVPTQGSTLNWDPVVGGFDIIGGTDLIMVKYQFI